MPHDCLRESRCVGAIFGRLNILVREEDEENGAEVEAAFPGFDNFVRVYILNEVVYFLVYKGEDVLPRRVFCFDNQGYDTITLLKEDTKRVYDNSLLEYHSSKTVNIAVETELPTRRSVRISPVVTAARELVGEDPLAESVVPTSAASKVAPIATATSTSTDGETDLSKSVRPSRSTRADPTDLFGGAAEMYMNGELTPTQMCMFMEDLASGHSYSS